MHAFVVRNGVKVQRISLFHALDNLSTANVNTVIFVTKSDAESLQARLKQGLCAHFTAAANNGKMELFQGRKTENYSAARSSGATRGSTM